MVLTQELKCEPLGLKLQLKILANFNIYQWVYSTKSLELSKISFTNLHFGNSHFFKEKIPSFLFLFQVVQSSNFINEECL
jgi:hypothetical protein